MTSPPETAGQASAETQRLQERLRALEKLGRAVGHDLNNALGSLLVTAQLVLEQLGPDDPLRADLEEIHRAGERASAIANRLLERQPEQEGAPG